MSFNKKNADMIFCALESIATGWISFIAEDVLIIA